MGGQRQREYFRRTQKLKAKYVKFLSNRFLEISDVSSLIKLLDINEQELISLINPEYINFKIKKGKNQFREINKPTKHLLDYQRKISNYLNCIYLLNQSDFCFSYTPSIVYPTQIINKNILEAAKKHIDKAIILKIDIKDFFPSITTDMVKNIFSEEPFSFNSEVIDFLVVSLTYNNSLPTGSPTSPILSNLIFKPIDYEIAKVSKNFNYTRYSDDLTISFDEDSSRVVNVIKKVTKILEVNGFKVNREKTRILQSNQRQEVNGLVVNKKININRKYYRELRAILHSIELDGITEASVKYTNKNKGAYFRALRNFYQSKEELYIPDKLLKKISHQHGVEWFFYMSLNAKIGYFRFIRGKEDKIYLNLKNSFYRLISISTYKKINTPKIVKQDEVVFVTNATSNSIVYYAYVFLTNSGYDNSEIDNLRSQFVSKKGRIDFDIIHKSFISQSLNFISLYSIMRSSKNFERIINYLEQTGKFEKIFKFNSDKISVIQQFNRKVFHDEYTCSYMKSDYNEDKFHKNTGVFSDELIKKKYKCYMIEKEYLVNLGMRLCKKCNEMK
jgi:RNA-directed DNA polymerase